MPCGRLNAPAAALQVMIGHPFDFMDVTRGCKVGGQQALFVTVSPTTVTSTEAVRSVDLSRRKCYFDEEVRANLDVSTLPITPHKICRRSRPT